MSLWLKNPHSVEAILKTRPQDVIELVLPKKLAPGAWERVEQLAHSQKVKVSSRAAPRSPSGPSRGEKDVSRGSSGGPQDRQGFAQAHVKDRTGIAAESLFQGAKERAGGRGLWLALDQVQDPHNLGAIFRTAAFFGVQGILLTQERSVAVTETVCDVACGGVEYVPFVILPNLKHGLEVAKEAGLWVLGSSEHATESLHRIQRDRPWLLVLGNEEQGMRRLTQESCDLLCSVSPLGSVGSLNVSVAAGVMISYLTTGESKA